MKSARVLPASVLGTALAILALGAAPVRAAGPVDLPIPAMRDEAAGVAMDSNRFAIANPVGKPLRYNLGIAIASNSNTSLAAPVEGKPLSGLPVAASGKARKLGGIGEALERGAGWSPRLASSSDYARILGFDREPFVYARSRPSVTILDQRIVLSRFSLYRKRIELVLYTLF